MTYIPHFIIKFGASSSWFALDLLGYACYPVHSLLVSVSHSKMPYFCHYNDKLLVRHALCLFVMSKCKIYSQLMLAG